MLYWNMICIAMLQILPCMGKDFLALCTFTSFAWMSCHMVRAESRAAAWWGNRE